MARKPAPPMLESDLPATALVVAFVRALGVRRISAG